MQIGSKSDGTLISEFFTDGTVLRRKTTQPDREAILQRNAELRKNPGALRHLESMGCELTIPVCDYHALIQKYPDLASFDAEIKRKAWLRFMGSAESIPYRVR